MPATLQIGLLVFPKLTRLDLTGPLQVFSSVASAKVLKTIWREVPKELANLTDPQVAEHLIPLLREPVG